MVVLGVIGNMLHSKFFPIFVTILLTVLLVPGEAQAYIDPGSGSILLQVILFAFASVFIFFRTLGGQLRQFFRRDSDKKESEEAESSVFDEEDAEE